VPRGVGQTRYFMTIPEACEVVVQAGATGSDGDVIVLDMGEQARHRRAGRTARTV